MSRHIESVHRKAVGKAQESSTLRHSCADKLKEIDCRGEYRIFNLTVLYPHRRMKESVDIQPAALRYNQGKRRWSLIHYKSLEPMVKVLEYGAAKYTKDGVSGDHNWKKGLNQTEILESLQRHLAALMDGEKNDPESGLPHIGHIMCNAMFYSFFQEDEQAPPH